MPPRSDPDRIERSTREARAAVEAEPKARGKDCASWGTAAIAEAMNAEATPAKKRKPKAQK